VTPSRIFGVCLGILVAGLVIGLGLPAPQPPDYLRGIEVAALIVTGVVVFWYTVETRELRLASDAQLALAKGREEALERSAQARAGLIAFVLRRQISSWLKPEPGDFDGAEDAQIAGLERRLKSPSFWKSVREAESRLTELVEIAATLSPKGAESVTAAVKSFYGAMDTANAFFDAHELFLSTEPELKVFRDGLQAIADTLERELVPAELRNVGTTRSPFAQSGSE
jgi:hypothetical protein